MSDGASLQAVLRAGADGAVFGTRFLLSPDALYSEEQKARLQAASSDQAVRTMAFDHARNELGWPAGVDGRGLVNLTAEEWDAIDPSDREPTSGSPLTYKAFQDRYKEAVVTGDPRRIVTWAGTGVGRMTAVMPAEDIVREIAYQAEL